ncbi:MAG: hypothetical protein DSY89_09695 [Deltaproteobacteria bacterium]|nr:MAG: hypothetical protein DSY89_09695 [Deltaproteobacteria bacterium]
MRNKILPRKSWNYFFAGMAVLLGLVAITGTGSLDDEGQVVVRNYDNHDYHVELFRSPDNISISSFILDDYDPFDPEASATFDNIDEGHYFLVIRFKEDDVDVVRDQSRVFKLDEGETECFQIDDDGDLDDC